MEQNTQNARSVSFVHLQDVNLKQKIHTKCAKLVDEKKYQLFYCLSVRDFEPKILFKGVHLTNSEKNVRQKAIFIIKK